MQFVEDVGAGIREPLVTTATFDQARTSYVNLPASRAHGLEASFTATPASPVELRAAYTFTDSLVTRGTELIETGEALPGVPLHQAAFTADLNLGPVSVGGTLTYVGERRTNIDVVSHVLGVDALDPYRRWDAYARWRLGGRLSVSIVGENLTDQRYQEVAGFPALGRFVRAGLQVGF